MFYPVFYNWQKRDLQSLKSEQKVFFDDGVEFAPIGYGQSIKFDVCFLDYSRKNFSGYWVTDKPQKLLVVYKADTDGTFDLTSDHIVLNKTVNGSYGSYGFFGLKPGRFTLNTTNGVGKTVKHCFDFSLLYFDYILEV